MDVKKTKKSHAHYEPDFKEEILRMLNSGKNVDEISKTFGISRNVLYTWKSKSQMKTKTKTSEEQTTYSLKLISENELLKKENARLQSERDILKNARQAFLLVLFSTSS
jgi:transposase